jgi:hypothetical protein
MKRQRLITLLVLVSAVALLSVTSVSALSDYALDWWSVDGGGGGGGAGSNSTGDPYSLGGTIGQPDAGASTSADGQYGLTGGIWAAALLPPPGAQTLTVGRDGTGTGTVTSAPPGIACGPTCAADFDFDTSVVLTAVADSNSTFTGWSDGACPGTGTCTLKMDAAHSVTATFTRNLHHVYLPLLIK